MGDVTVRKDFREDHMCGVTDEKVQFLLFLVFSFVLGSYRHSWMVTFRNGVSTGLFSCVIRCSVAVKLVFFGRAILPYFKSPDNVGRRQQARDKEISSYHLNLQSEGS
ncbi:hypothetical protein CDAR_102391 [Caerostris darwini]|uniref:Transmembrane protein n=1 Tax=Caerostris darwini TaxID=1538125 RepID=A0AAV4PS10_9ARAC|nr:hypothetical protein CDAR_102391 [Caerostris darwini]